jgi:hypothetical protein
MHQRVHHCNCPKRKRPLLNAGNILLAGFTKALVDLQESLAYVSRLFAMVAVPLRTQAFPATGGTIDSCDMTTLPLGRLGWMDPCLTMRYQRFARIPCIVHTS